MVGWGRGLHVWVGYEVVLTDLGVLSPEVRGKRCGWGKVHEEQSLPLR